LTKKGQKGKAARIVQQVFNILQNLQPHKKVNGPVILQEALQNVKPAFELRKARMGGTTQLIPASLPAHKQENKAFRTLIMNANLKHKKLKGPLKKIEMYTFCYFLAIEIQEASKNQGASCQAKQVLHKQAEHNRTFIRKRWW
jgi:small subunit ribosomal protein S7